jgi:hypothetical protein
MKKTIEEWREFFSHEPQQYWDLFMADVLQDMEELQEQGRDAQRYRFLADHYGRSKDLHMDGTSRWYINTPDLGKKPTVTLAQALDADMAEQHAADAQEATPCRSTP